MDTNLILFIAIYTFWAVIFFIVGFYGGKKSSSGTQSRAGDKLSILAHRREELERASMAWLYSRERGLTNTERREEQVMERFEREVATLENELFHPKAEGLATPKAETPKHKPLIQVDCIGRGVSGDYYIITCTLCGWESSSFSLEEVDAKIDAHEMEHA